MIYDVITIFPEFFRGPFETGILRRARAQGLADIRIHDLRSYTTDKHRTVDDRPFGGGEGMVLKPEPFFAAVESLPPEPSIDPHAETAIVLLSAQGKLLTQAMAQELAEQKRIVLLCGRYEGVDERVAEHLATLELSIGNYVLTGGELAAAVVVDAVTRLLPGALGDARSAVEESFALHPQAMISTGGILDCPHYTRPAEFRGFRVPEILFTGNHDEIRRWRRQQALRKTRRNRPELFEGAGLSQEDQALLSGPREP
jgi:tRNA (guanine37-N1)-methyltransferase